MELRPLDLGPRRCIALAQSRALAVQGGMRTSRGGVGQAATGARPAPIGLLGRWWLAGLGLDDESGRALLAATRGVTGGMVGGMAGGFGGGFGGPGIGMTLGALFGSGNDKPPLFLGLMFLAFGAAGIAGGFSLPKRQLKRWVSDPLAESELDDVIGATTDALERSYLSLVRDALRQSGLPEAVEREIRESIQTLGAAIESLPPVVATELRSAEELRADAQAVREKGLSETDSVVAESLLRRAEALDRQAEALGHSARALRRHAALREELATQTDALRLGLAAHYGASPTTPSADAAPLTALAESARRVAAEASSLARAQSELDEPARYPRVPSSDASEPTQQVLRR